MINRGRGKASGKVRLTAVTSQLTPGS